MDNTLNIQLVGSTASPSASPSQGQTGSGGTSMGGSAGDLMTDSVLLLRTAFADALKKQEEAAAIVWQRTLDDERKMRLQMIEEAANAEKLAREQAFAQGFADTQKSISTFFTKNLPRSMGVLTGSLESGGRQITTIMNGIANAVQRQNEAYSQEIRGDILGAQLTRQRAGFEGAANAARIVPILGDTIGGIIELVGKLATAGQERFLAADQAFRDRAQQVGQYSGPVAARLGQQSAANILGDVAQANRIGAQLAGLVQKQTELDLLKKQLQTLSDLNKIPEQARDTEKAIRDLTEQIRLQEEVRKRGGLTGNPVQDEVTLMLATWAAASQEQNASFAALLRIGEQILRGQQTLRDTLEIEIEMPDESWRAGLQQDLRNMRESGPTPFLELK